MLYSRRPRRCPFVNASSVGGGAEEVEDSPYDLPSITADGPSAFTDWIKPMLTDADLHIQLASWCELMQSIGIELDPNLMAAERERKRGKRETGGPFAYLME